MISKLRWWYYAIFTSVGTAFGLCLGMGSYTFYYAKGFSYLTNDPKACVNCHIMQEQYNGWINSSHRFVASCNDCHAPHSLLPKYFVKAKNGFFHSFYFTTGTYREPLRISKSNLKVTEKACRHCHEAVVHAIDTEKNGSTLSCTRCHLSVGHLH